LNFDEIGNCDSTASAPCEVTRTLAGRVRNSASNTPWQAISVSRFMISAGVDGTPLRFAVCARISTSSSGSSGSSSGPNGGLPEKPPSQ